MSSIITGYTYDIFISYRQKDNKGDRWVSEFVEALKIELEATFKEDVNVYFDINPHDGLLETHDVDASLKEKLKCLIFIPIISRTYCDPKSFAWEHEFKAFVEAASQDQFGLKVTLPNGNVAGRVLPVRIHDLDFVDIKLCESLLGGVLRGVDFVFKSPGVNRPLRANEDNPQDNLNKTYYRDQINKVANAADEIIHSMKSGSSSMTEKYSKDENDVNKKDRVQSAKFILPIIDRISKKTLLIFFSILFCIAGAFLAYKFFIHTNSRKSIAVIPYTYPNNDPKLSEYGIGAMDAIITKLNEVKSITVQQVGSSIQYLNTNKTLEELRKELNINYLVEINIRSISGNLKMGVVLKDTKDNRQLWGDQYDIDEGNLMPLFSEIAQTLTRNLNINLSTEEIINIETNLTKNPLAYRNYLAGNSRLLTAIGNKFVDSLSFVSAINMYDKAIEYDPDFASAYSRRAIARSWGIHIGQLNSIHIEKCLSDIQNALRIDKDLTDAQIAFGFYYYYCKKDYLNALLSFNTASVKNPENYQPLFYMAMVYRNMGDWKKSQGLINRVITLNPQDPLYLTNIGVSYTYLHKYDSALIYLQKAIDLNPQWSASYLNKIETLILKYGNTTKARAELDILTINTNETHIEIKILLDIYDGKYKDALYDTEKSGPEDFNIIGNKYLYLARLCILMNNPKNASQYYDAALAVFNLDLSKDSTNAEIHSLIGIANAGKGNKKKAVDEGKKAIELAILNKSKMDESNMILNLAKIYTMIDSFDDALYNIKYSLNNPSLISVKLLQIDPVWKPLRNHPEFKSMLSKHPNE